MSDLKEGEIKTLSVTKNHVMKPQKVVEQLQSSFIDSALVKCVSFCSPDRFTLKRKPLPPDYPLNRGLDGLSGWSGRSGNEKNPVAMLGLEILFLFSSVFRKKFYATDNIRLR